MNQPTECKYCGCDEIRSETDSAIHFRCFSSYWHDGDEWNIATNCAAKCAVQLVELRARVEQDIEFIKAREANVVTALKARLRTLNERVQRAVEVLEGATRYDIRTGYKAYMKERIDGEFIEHEEAEQAIEILLGNSPESPDSSPITTDDLAASDYFEAVRQRVPWMTAVEHIEGLVEGYRRCGVMVWQTADEILKVHGGEYGKAE